MACECLWQGAYLPLSLAGEAHSMPVVMDTAHITNLIRLHLAQALSCSVDELDGSLDADLEQLGMDSHNLMRCLLDVEAACGVSDLSLPDEALETPRSFMAGLQTAVLAQR